MHDYEELAASANELFGGRYSDSNVCYSVTWVRENTSIFGIHKVGSREVAIVSNHDVYKRAYSDYFQHEIDRYVGTEIKVKTVEQFIYRMDTVENCKNFIENCKNFIERRKDEIRCEIDRVEATIERDKQRLETLKKML